VKLWLYVFITLLFAPTLADCAENFWALQGTTARVVEDVTTAKKPDTQVSFIVSFNKALGCLAEIETLVITGSTLGRPIQQKWMTEKMSLLIDGNPIISNRTAITQYENGFSTTFLSPPSLLDQLKNGATVKTVMLPGSPAFEFPLAGSGPVIDSALRECRRMR